ncbi:MAG: HDOD domain-containing protein [Ectothiorhodospiraceae bacterium]|nr:HDOD domain-containing protein [Ectothiorhodospiraceae bacterium]
MSLVLLSLDRALQRVPQLSESVRRLLTAAPDGIQPEFAAWSLRREPVMERRVLLTANCPLLGLQQPVSTLVEAGSALGSERFTQVIAVAAVLDRLPPARVGQAFDRAGFWEHSAATAALARALALELGENPELAFIAGLLHDLGRAVLDAWFPREFLAVLRYRERHDVWIGDAEAAVLGFDHCAVGERVAAWWGVPPLVVQAIGWHHRPDEPQGAHPVTGIVHVSDVVVRGMRRGNPGDDTIPMLSEQTMARLGLDWSMLEPALDRADRDAGQALRLVQVMTAPEAARSHLTG